MSAEVIVVAPDQLTEDALLPPLPPGGAEGGAASAVVVSAKIRRAANNIDVIFRFMVTCLSFINRICSVV